MPRKTRSIRSGTIVSSVLLVLFFAAAFAEAARQEPFSARQVLDEINLARTQPHKFAEFLTEFRGCFRGTVYRMPGTATPFRSREGTAAVDEAIRFLSHQPPLPPLVWSEKLAAAALDLSREQGRSGAVGHGLNPEKRMRERGGRHRLQREWLGENISYGPYNPRFMVMRLLIDDGTPDRGHRKNLFNPAFASAGVTCGPHPRFESMCVMEFSGGF